MIKKLLSLTVFGLTAQLSMATVEYSPDVRQLVPPQALNEFETYLSEHCPAVGALDLVGSFAVSIEAKNQNSIYYRVHYGILSPKGEMQKDMLILDRIYVDVESGTGSRSTNLLIDPAKLCK